MLLTIHGYFMTLSVDEIKRRGQDDDRPLRMVKTVLYELTKASWVGLELSVACIACDADN